MAAAQAFAAVFGSQQEQAGFAGAAFGHQGSRSNGANGRGRGGKRGCGNGGRRHGYLGGIMLRGTFWYPEVGPEFFLKVCSCFNYYLIRQNK